MPWFWTRGGGEGEEKMAKSACRRCQHLGVEWIWFGRGELAD